MPSEFVGLAEETGSIEELGRFVLEEACRVAARWPATPAVPSVSVNVSAAQFCASGFAADVRAVLGRHGLAPARLVLEVTESVLVEPDPETLSNLTALRRAGITLALDDFGTGYSALSYLAHFPVDVLKLDRSFLAGLDERPAQVRLVAGIIGLGHSLGMQVVAEGIEDRGQLAQLRDLGVDLGQGYLLEAPMTSVALEARLAAGAPDAAKPPLRLIG